MSEEVKAPSYQPMPETGGPAFPFPAVVQQDHEWIAEEGDPGMTLRQWFAGMALQGALAGRMPTRPDNPVAPADWARVAFELADAMLAHEEGELQAWRARRGPLTPDAQDGPVQD